MIVVILGALVLFAVIGQVVAASATAHSPAETARREALANGDYVTANAAAREVERQQQWVVPVVALSFVLAVVGGCATLVSK